MSWGWERWVEGGWGGDMGEQGLRWKK